MDPTKKQLVYDGTTYIFHAPTAKDMIQVGLNARQMRAGIPDTDGFTRYSENVALLQQLCDAPEGIDFGDSRVDVTEYLTQEVSNWIDSFRSNVQGKSGKVDGSKG